MQRRLFHFPEGIMLQIGDEKKMTVREVAAALNVSERVVQKHASDMGLTENGKRTELTELQVTAIKNRIASSGRTDLANVCELPNVSTDLEMMILDAKVSEWKTRRIEELQKQLDDARPKIAFFDSVTNSKDAFDMKDAAKVLNIGMGRNTLFQKLRDMKILMDNNTPYQTFIDRGYFRVIESRWTTKQGEVKISLKTVVYQRGLDFILKELRK